ncbi:spore coat protein [Bacillus sp. BP-3]|uniref:spore coat protein n=2 Tax=unclassified Bacillus (in: firmicutes) TaxID=185979 RepID=UPI002330FB09|nr:spore coat protein [Bacillus sp. BP-3]MDC2867254.1 spore coat protein [Bacillus sp. BP-3]
MDDLKKMISSTLDGKQNSEMFDLLISNILNRNGITDSSLKKLPVEKKEQIKKIFSELQNQINNILD